MVSIVKYGQLVDLSKIVTIDGKKSLTLDNLITNNTIKINVPAGIKYLSELVENDLKITFTDTEDNVFELILKDMSTLLAQNDGFTLVEIKEILTDGKENIVAVTDLGSASQASAAGAGEENTNSDSGATPSSVGDNLSEQNNVNNADITNTPLAREFEAATPAGNATPLDLTPIEPDPVEPDPVEPDPVEPDPVEPDPVEPDPVETLTINENDLEDIPVIDYSYAGELIGDETQDEAESFAYVGNLTLKLLTTQTAIIDAVNADTEESLAFLKAEFTQAISDEIIETAISNSVALQTIKAAILAAPSVSTLIATMNSLDEVEVDVSTGEVSVSIEIPEAYVTELATNNLLNINVQTNGEYTVSSPLFNGMDDEQSVEFKFDYSINASGTNIGTETLIINGQNDAPVITTEEPRLETLSETDFLTLGTANNAYRIVTEQEMYNLLGIEDPDLNDEISLSLTTDSSTFNLNGEGAINSNTDGVLQLTQDDIDGFGLPETVNIGDFFIYSTTFDAMNPEDSTEVQFEIKAFDGTEYSEPTIVSLTVTGSNETLTINDNGELSFAANDQDINMSALLENISNSVIESIDSIDLSNGSHILSNLTIEDFEEMVSDSASNELAIMGEDNDTIKLDLDTWVAGPETEDNFIPYVANGSTDVLTLLIDKNIIVEDI